MNETNHQPAPDLLDHATRAVRATRVPAPPESLTAATVAAIRTATRAAEPAPSPPALSRRRLMFNYTRYGPAVAASVMTAALAGLLFFGTGTASAWQEVVAQVKKASTVTYDEVQVNELQPMLPTTRKCYVKDGMSRYDILGFRDTFHIINYKTGEVLQVNGSMGTYRRYTTRAEDRKQIKPVSIIDQLGKLSAQPSQAAGEEKLDGRVTKKVLINNARLAGHTGIMTVWYDPQTKLPVKIYFEVESTFPKITQTLENFQWNVPLDDSLFNPEIPKGLVEEDPVEMRINK